VNFNVVTEMLQQLQFATVQVGAYIQNLLSCLENGTEYGIEIVKNSNKISCVQTRFIAYVMNEAGVATNAVNHLLTKKNRDTGLFRWEGKRNKIRIGTQLYVPYLYAPLNSIAPDDSDLDSDGATENEGHVEAEPNGSETNTNATQSVLPVPAQVNPELLEAIARKINISKGGRTTKMLIRTKGGHILKSGSNRQELALWVYQMYGEHFENFVSCS
jgi:hypothetical protein